MSQDVCRSLCSLVQPLSLMSREVRCGQNEAKFLTHKPIRPQGRGILLAPIRISLWQDNILWQPSSDGLRQMNPSRCDRAILSRGRWKASSNELLLAKTAADTASTNLHLLMPVRFWLT